MILVIGGAYQGKLAFARTLQRGSSGACIEGDLCDSCIDGGTCGKDEIYDAALINHLHLYLKRFPMDSKEALSFADLLARRNPDVTLVCNELGYGVVPMEKEDRAWRELCGRVCTAIAAQSEAVYRVICGIGTQIKGDRKYIAFSDRHEFTSVNSKDLFKNQRTK